MANFQVLPMSRVQDLQVYKEIEDLHSVVPFHRQMLAAILVIVTILGAKKRFRQKPSRFKDDCWSGHPCGAPLSKS